MQTELFTVSRVFTETLFRIPDYQRGYSWGIDQLNDFWIDIEQLHTDSKHYLGVLTLEKVPENKWDKWEDDAWIIKSKNFKPYYVVDGQQRLTTIVIFIIAILENTKEKHLNFTELKDIQKKYIFDAKPEGISKSYIFGYEKDNPSYEYLKTHIFMEKSDIHHPKQETIYTKNLFVAKSFFTNKLKNMTAGEINTVFVKTTQQFVFNAYEISNDIDVFVTFETMNNRGKLLTTLELLKNRLIFLSTKLPTSAGDGSGNRLRRVINDAWKSAYHYLGKNSVHPIVDDVFLRTFFTYFYLTQIEKIPDEPDARKDRMLQRFEMAIERNNRFLLNELFAQNRLGQDENTSHLPKITRNFIYKFSQQLKESVELYYNLSSPNDSNYSDEEKNILKQLGRLMDRNIYPLIFSVYRIENVEAMRIKMIKELEKYYFIQSVLNNNYRRRRHGQYYYSTPYISKNITGDELLESVTQDIDGMLKEGSIVESLTDWGKFGKNYYTWKFVRYFFFEYEVYLHSQSKRKKEKIDWNDFVQENYEHDFSSIEHIYPQKAHHPYWTSRFSKFTQAQKNALRNSLGNLLALSKAKNSSLSNKPFNEKRDAELTGYRFGSYSENEITLYDEWTEKEILERGIKMLVFMEKRWKIEIGNEEQKIKALGLDFLTSRKSMSKKYLP